MCMPSDYVPLGVYVDDDVVVLGDDEAPDKAMAHPQALFLLQHWSRLALAQCASG